MTANTSIRRTLALLVAVLTVTAVLGPVGTVAAVDGISVSQQADSTTVSPGDTVTLATDVSVDSSQITASSIGLQEDLPDGWTVTSRNNGNELGAGPDGWLWFESVGSVDGSDTVTYTVEVPDSASAGDYTLSITASTEGGESTTTQTTITVESTNGNDAPSVDAIEDQTVVRGETVEIPVSASDGDGDALTLSANAPDFVSLSDNGDGTGTLTVSPQSGDVGTSTVDVVADDGTTSSTESFQLTVDAATDVTEGTVLSRVNAGESETIAANDGGPDWVGVTDTSSQYLDSVGSSNAGTTCNGTPVTVGSEVPASTPDGVYECERYGEMTWTFDVTPNADVEVRLYIANRFTGADQVGERQFNVAIEGDQVLTQYDPVADVGHATGTVKSFTTTDDGDGTITIDFTKGAVENPTVRGLEIVDVGDTGSNTAPTVDAIDDQSVVEGDSLTVPVTASDADGDDVSLSVTGPDFVTLANGELTITPQSGDAANSPYTIDVTADDGTDQTTESFQLTVTEPTQQTGSALVEVLPDSGNVDASTYGSGSYQVTNTGEREITSVSFDLSTATLPDMVFDPDGTAGDPTGEGLNIVSDGGTGITTAGGGSDEAFSQPHNGVDGSDGYDVMTVEFGDFQNGETATFWADNDPTSIKGATVGSQEAGPVSGLELARATVTVTYADGTSQTTQLIGDGSDGGSTAVVTDGEQPAPTIGAQGVTLDGSVLDGYHSGATVSQASQTITVSGEPGETFTLVRVEGELALSNVPDADNDGEPGYDVEEFEANNLVAAEYYSGTLDANGEATVPVTLTDSADDDDEAGFNYFVAAHGEASGDMGLASNVVVLQYDQDATNTDPTIDAVTDVGVSQGDSTTVDVSASDADGDTLTLSDSGPDWVTLSDAGDGTGALTVAPGTDVAVGTYTVEVTVSDGQASATEEFAVYVDNADQDGEVVFAVNAGGSEYTTGDGTVYQADTAFDGGSTYNTGQAIAGTDDDALYQSERYGGADGGNFGYDVPISEPGTYEVTLQFAEIFQGVAGSDSPGGADGTDENDRLFSVSIEGQQVVSEYDLFSEVGPLTATEKTYTVEVTEAMLSDGTLNIDFSASADNGKISAITVEQLATDDGAPGAIGDFQNAPTDPDGDGLYEDVNGDGDVNVGDAQALFANQDDPVVQNNVDAFDFNGDGAVNVGDAQAIFANGVSAGDA